MAINQAFLQFERRSVETGLSDGTNVEVASGLTESDKIEDPNSAS